MDRQFDDRSVRLSATYPATDGSMPEAVEVVWDGYIPAVSEVAVLVVVLGALPRRRLDREDV